MTISLKQILGSENLCGVVEEIKGGIPIEVIPPAFQKVTRTIEGNTGVYDRVQGTRKTATLVHYGSPSVKRETTGVSQQPVTLLHTFEHIDHNPNVLLALRDIGNESRQKRGMAEITRRTKEFVSLFQNLRKASILSSLIKFAIYFDSSGNLLPSSSGASITVDFGVPAGNLNQLDILGTGNIIDASWGTAGTAIHKQISAIRAAALKKTGYPITHAFYGANILDHLLGNTKLKEIINRNVAWQTAALSNEIADGFLKIDKWIPVREAFFEDKDGAYQNFIGDNDIVFTPTPSPEWWEVIEGTYVVPTNIGNVSADGIGAIENTIEKAGMFSYAVVKNDPVGIKHLAGDTFLPVIKVPNAVFRGTVVF